MSPGKLCHGYGCPHLVQLLGRSQLLGVGGLSTLSDLVSKSRLQKVRAWKLDDFCFCLHHNEKVSKLGRW